MKLILIPNDPWSDKADVDNKWPSDVMNWYW